MAVMSVISVCQTTCLAAADLNASTKLCQDPLLDIALTDLKAISI